MRRSLKLYTITGYNGKLLGIPDRSRSQGDSGELSWYIVHGILWVWEVVHQLCFFFISLHSDDN